MCTLKFSDKFNIINNSRDDHGRRSIIEIESNEGQRYTIVNTYFPAKTEGNQQKFIEDTKTTLQNFHQEGNIVWGGDFNIDEEEGTTTAQHSFQLKSTLPFLERDNPRHTFEHRNIELHAKRNLDRFYVPNPTDDIITRHIATHKRTDHFAVYMEMSNTSIGQQRRKSAYWKLNNTLLDIEECKKALVTTLEICKMEAEKCPEKAVEIWITTKDNIKKICTKIAKTENHKMKDKIKRLQAILDTQDLSAEYRHRLRQELDELEERKYRGAAIRCRIDMEQTDIATGYFLKREQNVQRNRQIEEIILEDGNTTREQDKIKEQFTKFYRDLYTDKEDKDPEITEKYISYAKRISDEDRQEQEKLFTKEEINKAIKDLNKNKSPGPDRLTNEFDKEHIDKLTTILKIVTDEITRREDMPQAMTNSLITLLPKDENYKRRVGKYRPISLLNTDYKIISKILTGRLAPHMEKLIHEDQQCAVKGRKIQNHLHNIRETITYCQQRNIKVRIISLDQEKAFDRVSHEFLHKTLEANNLPEHFRKWIRTLYKNPTSQVIVNQELTEEIKLTRAVRQGCSLSPLLYTLVLEPLLKELDGTTTSTRYNCQEQLQQEQKHMQTIQFFS